MVDHHPPQEIAINYWYAQETNRPKHHIVGYRSLCIPVLDDTSNICP
jgi:hypothetical protein